MKKLIPIILQLVGLILLGFGIYQAVVPEASINIDSIGASVSDSNDAYLNIVIGLAAIGLGFFMGKKK